MLIRTLSAETIARWERDAGPICVHGVSIELSIGGEIERHRHSNGQLMYCPTGAVTVFSQGSAWVAGPQRAVWIAPATQHWVHANSSASVRNLLVRSDLAVQLPSHCCALGVEPLSRELILTAVDGPRTFARGSRADNVLRMLVSEFREDRAGTIRLTRPRDRRLLKVCNSLQANPSDERSLEDFAAEAGASCRTLARLFLKETGMTFSQWRRTMRFVAALQHLANGEPVTRVAYLVGYESASAFVESFRLAFGQTPGQYLGHH